MQRPGGGSCLVSPWGRAAGEVQLQERPWAPVVDVLAELEARLTLSARRVLRLDAWRDPDHPTTVARAHFAVLSPREREMRVAWALRVEPTGVVEILGIARLPEAMDLIDPMVGHLARHTRHRAAPPPRLSYQPPAGWRGVSRGWGAEWLAPQYPRSPGRLAVSAVEPATGDDLAFDLGALLAGGTSPGAIVRRETDAWTSAHGLDVRTTTLVGGAGDLVELAVVSSGDGVARLRLETQGVAAAAQRALLRAVVDTATLPRGPAVVAAPSPPPSLFANWV